MKCRKTLTCYIEEFVVYFSFIVYFFIKVIPKIQEGFIHGFSESTISSIIFSLVVPFVLYIAIAYELQMPDLLELKENKIIIKRLFFKKEIPLNTEDYLRVYINKKEPAEMKKTNHRMVYQVGVDFDRCFIIHNNKSIEFFCYRLEGIEKFVEEVNCHIENREYKV